LAALTESKRYIRHRTGIRRYAPKEGSVRFQAISGARGPAAILAIRLLVGGVFFLEGIKKFLFVEQWGAGRFARIGIPFPGVMGPFVGGVEIVCGFLVLGGLFTRLASVPLLITISVAIAATKIPILLRSGFWPMEAEARTDYSMLMGSLFLILAGAGSWSVDAWLARKTPQSGIQ
jgi:putative oxidoreductase